MMGYHPETLAFSFPPYPRGGASLTKQPQPFSFGRALYALKPWIGFDVWHIDPEKPRTGNRQDDSCGWFDRTPGQYADAAVYLLRDQSLMHDVELVLERKAETRAPFYEGISERVLSYPQLTAADALAVCLMVARELELRRWWNGQDGKSGKHAAPVWRRPFIRRRNVDDIAMGLALNPLDNLRASSSGESLVRLIAAALNRHFRPWWKHPRWHVHHWQVNFDFTRNLRRMFRRCPTCQKRLGFGYSPSNPGDGTLHHGDCLGWGVAAKA